MTSDAADRLHKRVCESGQVHENVLMMRERLAREFGTMAEVQDLDLLDLCDLYVEVEGGDDAE